MIRFESKDSNSNIDNNIIWSNTVFVWLERIVGLMLIGVGITSR